MPASDRDTSKNPKRIVLLVGLCAAALLIAFAGLAPHMSGDDRDMVVLGKLDTQSSNGISSSLSPSSSSASASSGKGASSVGQRSSVASSLSIDAEAADVGDVRGSAGQAVPFVAESRLLTEALDNPVDFNAAIEEQFQFPDVPGACEVSAMVSVLRAMGYDINVVDFSNNYLMALAGDPDMVHGFSGSPFEQGAAFPPIMVRAGNAYLREQGSEWRFVERKGALFSTLLSVVDSGRPVLVWSTMSLAPALHSGSRIEGYEWYDNEHCVVLYGKTDEGNLLVMDPLEGKVERDGNAFKDIYYDCGSMSVTLSRLVADQDNPEELELNRSSEDQVDSAEAQ